MSETDYEFAGPGGESYGSLARQHSDSGDPHFNSDLDSSPFSQHHTLGFRHGQASPGDHIHDGGTSKLLPASSLAALFTWTPFTNGGNPIWVSDATQPSLGSGSIEARYIKIGTLVIYHWALKFAADTTFGTGNWEIILPFTARTSPVESSNTFTGIVKAYSGDTNTNSVGAMFAATTSRIAITSHGGTAAWGPTVPLTWHANANNHMNGQLVYESAS